MKRGTAMDIYGTLRIFDGENEISFSDLDLEEDVEAIAGTAKFAVESGYGCTFTFRKVLGEIDN